MSLIWQDVCFKGSEFFGEPLYRKCFESFLPMRHKSYILDNLNGKINFGELTALMGPSGAGKSTLLKFITQGKHHEGCKGKLFIDSSKKIRASFITQEEKDHLLLNLTVYESVFYASEIKNPSGTTKYKHNEIVEEILTEMELEIIKNNTVEKCSGGEKKRLAIALELTSVQKPNFLFLDEPTSGLDSYSGFNVAYLLKKLAHSRNMAIVTTIHQPSFEILELFNQIYLISKAGNCIYEGPPGDIHGYLSSYGYNHSEFGNPADSIIKIASSVNREDVFTGWRNMESQEIEMSSMLLGIGNTPDYCINGNKSICEKMTKDIKLKWLLESSPALNEIQDVGLCNSNADFSFTILWVLMKRTFRASILKQKKLIFIRFALHAIVALVMALLFKRHIGLDDGCRIHENTTTGIHSNYTNGQTKNLRHEDTTGQNVRFQFFSMLFLMFAALMPTVLTFPAEIKIFLNEHRNGWYSTGTYYLSKTIVEIPVQFVFSSMFTYFLYLYSQQIGMEEWYNGFFGFMSWRYGYFLWVTVISCFIAQGFGFLIGILCVNSFNIAIILSSSVLLFLFLFSGFFVKVFHMVQITKALTHLSFVRFSFESVLIVIYGFDRCQNMKIGSNIFPAQSAVLYAFYLEDSDLVNCIYWLIAHLFVTRIISFILLKKLAEPEFLSLKYIFHLNPFKARPPESVPGTPTEVFYIQ